MPELKLSIQEYGKEIRSYSDTDKVKFMDAAVKLINDHLMNRSNQGTNEVKNINIHIYTNS